MDVVQSYHEAKTACEQARQAVNSWDQRAEQLRELMRGFLARNGMDEGVLRELAFEPNEVPF